MSSFILQKTYFKPFSRESQNSKPSANQESKYGLDNFDLDTIKGDSYENLSTACGFIAVFVTTISVFKRSNIVFEDFPL